ncbi:Possible transcriptional regulator [Mycobacteroides abscessus]|nr:Possible transcriptional regulator [Mycobacteroides abscessus]
MLAACLGNLDGDRQIQAQARYVGERVRGVDGQRVSNAASDIGGFIRAQREAAQVSVRQLAEKAGVSNPYLSQIERGLRRPSAEVLNQIAKALRVSAEVLYVRAGILDRSDASPVRDAIIADTFITERQKQVLLDVYSSFVQQNAEAQSDVAESDLELPATTE